MPTALGIESTAWNFSASVSTEDEVLSLASSPYEPADGGIHPREASRSHSRSAAGTIRDALDQAGVGRDGVDLVSFARGPGMGPCLRVGATAARAFAASCDVPVLGVNHCLAHVEAGLFDTEAENPVVLNVSGANTQVLLPTGDNYGIFGETLDVGLGNALDKLAREAGLSHPGGPKLEEAAGDSDELLDLPYLVKGMDLAFSGLVTAAARHLDRGEGLPVVANSMQETAFAMVTEVAERALAHAGTDELLVVGGVAHNDRLFEMLETMADGRGAEVFRPSPELLGDNGAMVALTGLRAWRHGLSGGVRVEQGFRVDEAEAPWTSLIEPSRGREGEERGAEAVVELREEAVKRRPVKEYRHPELDSRLRRLRTGREAKALMDARRAGVPTPVVSDLWDFSLAMERLPGERLRDAGSRRAAEVFVEHLAVLHGEGMVHGDPTTSNALVEGEEVFLVDIGLARYEDRPEPKAVDLRLLFRCLATYHGYCEEELKELEELYLRAGGEREVLKRLEEIEGRGRYL